uniref:Uncharacterized protein n=1 Tax=Anguilla anguilla TaxID=7936 RepID=A0A0E9QDL7_ANGAN
MPEEIRMTERERKREVPGDV